MKATQKAPPAKRPPRGATNAARVAPEARDALGTDEPAPAATQPRPKGWRDPMDLLEELLRAFGWKTDRFLMLTGTMPDERKVQLAILPAEKDPEERQKRWRREIDEAGPLLAELVVHVRKLTALPLPTPAEPRAQWQGIMDEWQGIIDQWNKGISDNDWRMLPPLCEVCGKRVDLRQSERISTDNYDLSTVCSPHCQQKRGKSTARRRKRKRKQ